MGGERIFIKKGENDDRKVTIGSEQGSMASLIPIQGGLVGLKSGIAKRRWVSPLLFARVRRVSVGVMGSNPAVSKSKK